MFTGTDMAILRNTVRDFRKLSFMGDINFFHIDLGATENLGRDFSFILIRDYANIFGN